MKSMRSERKEMAPAASAAQTIEMNEWNMKWIQWVMWRPPHALARGLFLLFHSIEIDLLWSEAINQSIEMGYAAAPPSLTSLHLI